MFELSESNTKILKVLLEVKQAVGVEPIKRNAKNADVGSTYADVAAVLARVEPVLQEKGCVSITHSDYLDGGMIRVETRVIHVESGEWVSRSVSFTLRDFGAHPVGGAETYGRRYNHTGLFNLASEDDDGNAANAAARAPKAASASAPAPSSKAAQAAAQAHAAAKANGKGKAPERPSRAYAEAKEVVAACDDAELGRMLEKVRSHSGLSPSEKGMLECVIVARQGTVSSTSTEAPA